MRAWCEAVIIIAGHLRVAAPERDQYLTAVQGVAALARRAPGCYDFVQAADPIDLERMHIDEHVAKYRIASVEDP